MYRARIDDLDFSRLCHGFQSTLPFGLDQLDMLQLKNISLTITTTDLIHFESVSLHLPISRRCSCTVLIWHSLCLLFSNSIKNKRNSDRTEQYRSVTGFSTLPNRSLDMISDSMNISSGRSHPTVTLVKRKHRRHQRHHHHNQVVFFR